MRGWQANGKDAWPHLQAQPLWLPGTRGFPGALLLQEHRALEPRLPQQRRWQGWQGHPQGFS